MKIIILMGKSRSESNMEKSKPSKDLKDKQRYKIVVQEVNKFNDLIKGHRKILEAIGSL